MTLARLLLSACLGVFGLAAQAPAQDRDAIVLIGHAGAPRLDSATVQRLYTGRAVEVGGAPVVVVNGIPGTLLRERFMATVMDEDDDKFIAYWTVRKYIGEGTPPRELKSLADVVAFVQATSGGVGYVAASEIRPGMNVVWRP